MDNSPPRRRKVLFGALHEGRRGAENVSSFLPPLSQPAIISRARGISPDLAPNAPRLLMIQNILVAS